MEVRDWDEKKVKAILVESNLVDFCRIGQKLIQINKNTFSIWSLVYSEFNLIFQAKISYKIM
jgi:hypothetical protein